MSENPNNLSGRSSGARRGEGLAKNGGKQQPGGKGGGFWDVLSS
jgi:hypothetical protein